MDSFGQRKKDMLSKEDKSSAGSWDSRVVDLCRKINSFDDYYTTSSCSGRIVVLKDQNLKEKGMFGFVGHDFVDLEGFMDEISSLLSAPKSLSRVPTRTPCRQNICNMGARRYSPSHNPDEISTDVKGEKLMGNYKFKQDPAILHVACRDLESAQKLLEKGLNAGWKRSGIISLGKNIIVELNLTEKLEFPLIEEGELLVGKDFLEKVIEKGNLNLGRGWDKIDKLIEKFD